MPTFRNPASNAIPNELFGSVDNRWATIADCRSNLKFVTGRVQEHERDLLAIEDIKADPRNPIEQGRLPQELLS